MTILQENPYTRFFKDIKDVPALESHIIVLKCYFGVDQCVFNLPTTSQMAAIWTETNDESVEKNSHLGL